MDVTLWPPQSGVYVVGLRNDDPISVNADRLGVAERCIKVTRANCKFGRAVNLQRRQGNYMRTFGAQNVVFHFFAVTPHYREVERRVGGALLPHRKRGATGRLNEWLEGIAIEEVERLVRQAVNEVIASTANASPAMPEASPVPTPPQRKGPPARSLARTFAGPSQIVQAARYLQEQGMELELLRDLHHFPRRSETFAATMRYFGAKTSLRERNIAYGARLLYVAEQHQRGHRAFRALVEEALERFPPGRDI
jgi:hypothetical protein